MNTIKIYDRRNLDVISCIESAHSQPVEDIQFSKQNSDYLLSCSRDGTVAVWDTRANAKATIFSAGPEAELWSFSLNSSGTVLAAGSEAIIYFWDIRSNKSLAKFEDSHTESVTSVKFHPIIDTQIISASVDGLICLYDITRPNEDDALVSVLNPDESISTVGFFGPNFEFLYCITHTEQLSLWSLQKEEQIKLFPDTRQLNGQMRADYLLGCNYTAQQQLFLLSGLNSGEILIHEIGQDGLLHPRFYLPFGHNTVVRAFDWGPNSMVTAGEDSKICLWSANPVQGNIEPTNINKM